MKRSVRTSIAFLRVVSASAFLVAAAKAAALLLLDDKLAICACNDLIKASTAGSVTLEVFTVGLDVSPVSGEYIVYFPLASVVNLAP